MHVADAGLAEDEEAESPSSLMMRSINGQEGKVDVEGGGGRGRTFLLHVVGTNRSPQRWKQLLLWQKHKQ
jgi:hypothetical protein